MITFVSPRNCKTCDKILKGRTDKKFCDDYCRNAFNNQLHAGRNNFIRKVNNTLARNRRILEGLLGPSEKEKMVHRDRLLESGFRFGYCTHIDTIDKNTCRVFCYDYGYMAVKNGHYQLLRKNEEE